MSSTMRIAGGIVAYELLGNPSDPLVVITPGGRFTKEVPGLPPLAEAVVAGGMQVLLWDRPNCGESDVQFYGRSESHMRAETLAALLKGLDVGPCVIAGGSGGARDSMLTVMLYPELATRLVLWNIVGGISSTLTLAGVYVLPSLGALKMGGLPMMMDLPEWKALIDANPVNRERMEAIGEDGMRTVILRWLNAYVPKPGQTIPGVEDEMFTNITIPTMIVRGGENDLDHPKRTSMEVHCLIKGSQLIEPPWPEDAWETSLRAEFNGTGHIFDPWVQLAPALLDFARGGVGA
jgi:2-hydroxy-6-oxonona-2,4-dienedioate hydrolase